MSNDDAAATAPFYDTRWQARAAGGRIQLMAARTIQTRAGATLLTAIIACASLAAAPSAVDAAFKAFWDAPSPDAAGKAIDGVVKTNLSFADALARLKHGRDYAPNAPTGMVRLSHHFA